MCLLVTTFFRSSVFFFSTTEIPRLDGFVCNNPDVNGSALDKNDPAVFPKDSRHRLSENRFAFLLRIDSSLVAHRLDYCFVSRVR